MLRMGQRTDDYILMMLQIPEGLWPLILQRLQAKAKTKAKSFYVM